MSGYVTAVRGRYSRPLTGRLAGWVRGYLLHAGMADFACACIGAFAAVELRFPRDVTGTYVALSVALPLLWLVTLSLAGGYDPRFIGTGSDEFRKVMNASLSLTATVAIFSYLFNIELSRAYLLIALPSMTVLDLLARLVRGKQLHRRRKAGHCTRTLVAVGHEPAVAGLINELRRDHYHGFSVV